MFRKSIIFIFIIFILHNSFAQNIETGPVSDILSMQQRRTTHNVVSNNETTWCVEFLNRILYKENGWNVKTKEYDEAIKKLLHHAEDISLDTSLVRVQNMFVNEQPSYLVNRKYTDIENKSKILGYTDDERLSNLIAGTKIEIKKEWKTKSIIYPKTIFSKIDNELKLIPDIDPYILIAKNSKGLPKEFLDTLRQNLAQVVIPDTLNSLQADSIRAISADSIRIGYNNRKIALYKDSVQNKYRVLKMNQYSDSVINKLKVDVASDNRKILIRYNRKQLKEVNDSIWRALTILNKFADQDSINMRFRSIGESFIQLRTDNSGDNTFKRMYVHNFQNDSIGILMINRGRGKTGLLIDDAVRIMRMSQASVKEATIIPLIDVGGDLMPSNYILPDPNPWNFHGDSNLGFTESYLNNWASGGETSIAMLATGKYYLTYNKEPWIWENSVEVRYGTTKSRSEDQFLKNDDYFEFSTRLGKSAFKKWYYSTDFDLKTQLAKGFEDAPDLDSPTSKILCPAYLSFSLGLDYKPNDNFSLFVSPLNMQATVVTDTVRIDQTKYGIDEDEKQLWEPGIKLTCNFKKTIKTDFTFESKLDFFTGYMNIFRDLRFNWEGTLNMQINQYINTQIMCNLVYDDNVLFSVTGEDSEGNMVELYKKPKLQTKQLFTIGFVYKFY